jgi:hypothetical protein
MEHGDGGFSARVRSVDTVRGIPISTRMSGWFTAMGDVQ